MKFLKKLDSLSVVFLPISFIFITLNFVYKSNLLIVELGILSVIVYIALSLIHHYRDQSLKVEVALEYFLIGLLALVIILGTI